MTSFLGSYLGYIFFGGIDDIIYNNVSFSIKGIRHHHFWFFLTARTMTQTRPKSIMTRRPAMHMSHSKARAK